MDRRRLLLRKYREKTLSPRERDELFEDLRTSDVAQYEAAFDEVWSQTSDEANTDEASTDEPARRVYARLQRELTLSPRRTFFPRRVWMRAAAVLIVGLAVALYWLTRPPSHFVTEAGETRMITLPDASVVTLNERSELHYDLPWDDESPREVWLTGEAYFSVQHTATDQPFVVHTDPVAIQVLGTEFNVHNRNHQPEVILTSGSVQLTTRRRGQPHTITLEPGERGALAETQMLEKSKVNPVVYTAWTKHELVLDSTPLPEVAELLERQYDVPVILSDSTLRSVTLSGTYPSRQLSTVLEMLSEVLAAEAVIERSDQRVIIRKK